MASIAVSKRIRLIRFMRHTSNHKIIVFILYYLCPTFNKKNLTNCNKFVNENGGEIPKKMVYHPP